MTTAMTSAVTNQLAAPDAPGSRAAGPAISVADTAPGRDSPPLALPAQTLPTITV
jgi:hypothetical protein